MDSYRYNRRVRRMEKKVKKYHENILINCGFTLCQSTFTEMYVLGYTTNYLDLALTLPSHMTLRRLGRAVLYGWLDDLYREHYLAETVPLNDLVKWVYDPTEYMGIPSAAIEVYMARMLLLFEDENVVNISEKDPDEKIRRLRKYLRAYRVLKIDHFHRMFDDLLHICVNPPLDCGLTVDLLTSFCDSNQRKLSVFYSLQDANGLENLILHAKKMRFDFWGLWSENGALSWNYYFVIYEGLTLNHEYSNILLKYGFPYTTSFLLYLERCMYLDNTRFEGQPFVQSLNVISEHASLETRTRMMLLIDTFLVIGEFESVINDEDKVKTLRNINRSLSLPYVTPTELYDTMLQVVMPHFIPELQSIVFKYSTSDIFDGEFEILMPKRLFHLCRVAVRKLLADNFLLLEQLPIPNRLKPFLELES